MKYRRLGDSGTIVSVWCMGTMTFGWEADEAASVAMLDAFAAAGGNFIDTADVYSAGAAELIIGRWLKAHPTEAKQMVVTTKGFGAMGKGANELGTSRKHLADALDASLTRLGLERIDLYQMHAWDYLTPIEETLRFLDDAVRAGKISYYGFSNYLGWQVAKAAEIAKARDYSAPLTLQPQYNLLVRDIEFEVVPACLDAGIGLLPWGPLGGGWLSGKYRRDILPSGSTRLGEDPNRGVEAFGPRNAEEQTWAVIGAMEAIVKARGASMAQVALAWLVDRSAVTSVILGARTTSQLAENLQADALTLTSDETVSLDLASKPRASPYPYGTGVFWHRKVEGPRE